MNTIARNDVTSSKMVFFKLLHHMYKKNGVKPPYYVDWGVVPGGVTETGPGLGPEHRTHAGRLVEFMRPHLPARSQ